MKEEVYDSKLTIAKFPQLKDQILSHDFKVIKLVDSDGKCVGRIVRFPNLAIFKPNAWLTNRIFSEVFGDYSEENIHLESFGLLGLDIVAKGPTKSPIALMP